MNALLVDDERLARSELRRLLQAHPEVSVVGEAANADEAAARLAELDVDVLFLDVQMPGASGFDLLERLDSVPLLIFTTAYDEYAVRAFEVNAFDYLLKPIRPERLAAALERTRRTWAELRSASAAGRTRRVSDRVFVRDGERCWIIPLADIALCEAQGNYTRVHFGTNRPLLRTSLQALEARLDPAVFFRVSRSHIVNLRFIEEMAPAVDDSYTVRLRGGRIVAVSRRQSRRLRDTLSL
jgi:two-component system, LytTR family, response regulator